MVLYANFEEMVLLRRNDCIGRLVEIEASGLEDCISCAVTSGSKTSNHERKTLDANGPKRLSN